MEPRNLQWVDCANGHRPPNAQQAGVEGSHQIFVARAHFNGGMVPGKFVTGYSTVFIPYNGKEFQCGQYQVLVTPPGCVSWVDATGGQIPPHAIPGGTDPNTNEIYYIGRATHNGMVTLGKVHSSHRCCYIPFGGSEHSYSQYEVLTKNLLGRHLNV